MIKMVIVGRRRSGMTLAQLHSYLLNIHGPMVVAHIKRDGGALPKRYVQNHAFDGFYKSAATPISADPFSLNRDFVTQVWFDDVPQAMAALQQPFYLSTLQPDEDNFVEQSSVVKLPVIDKLVSGTQESKAGFKTFVFAKRAASMTLDEFHLTWSALLSGISQTLATTVGGLERHVQCTVMHRPNEQAPIDGISECWFTSKEQATQGLEHIRQVLSTHEISTIGLSAQEHVLYV